MATITTNTFLDGGTARTAGETWTMNGGARLTIRTDTRWHANAPASMTGSLGTCTLSTTQGGSVFIEGRNVRQLTFDTGSGNVPAIGTTITQGGVSGYLLGVWADYTTAPTAVGAAIPASGFIKFREVTGGAFTTGALTGIGANATTADITSWMEVVFDNNAAITCPGIGATSGYYAYGSWFSLGTTNGSAGQTFQVPTNGGGSSTQCLGVQIETAVGSGVYEWWPSSDTSRSWTTANLTTDSRAKVIQSAGNGLIRIGSDGTSNIGYTPVTGLRVRVPNVFIRGTTSAARAVNGLPSVRGALTASNGGTFILDTIETCQNLNINAPDIINFNNTSTSAVANFANPQTSVTLSNTLHGGYYFETNTILTVSTTNNPVNITNITTAHDNQQGRAIYLNFVSNAVIDGLKIVGHKLRTGTQKYGLEIASCENIEVSNIYTLGCPLSIISSSNITINDYDYIDSMAGATYTTQSNSAIYIQSNCYNVLVDGVTFGNRGVLNNTNPYAVVFYVLNNLGFIKIRNMGTRSSPVSSGSNSAAYPSNVIQCGDSNCKFQRLYLTGTRNAPVVGSSKNSLIEHIYGTMTISQNSLGVISTFRGVGATPSAAETSLQTGLIFHDMFSSDITGSLLFDGQKPDSTTAAYSVLTLASGSLGGYRGNGTIGMPTINDEIIIESPYWIKGHTAFENTTPVKTGTQAAYINFTYQIDTGSGWNGTWKTLDTTNLTGETISASGFKIKIKGVTGTADSTTALTKVRIYTTSTLSAQSSNLYPLDTVSVTLTGLQTNSEVRAYTGTDPATAVEISGIENSGTSFTFTHSNAGEAGYIQVFSLGYQPITIPYTYTTSDDSILIQHTVDRNYVNP